MSCLERDMEYAMMDTVAEACKKQGITEIRGYYYPTAEWYIKGIYALQGFEKIKEDEQGNTEWRLSLADGYEVKNHVIDVENDL